VISRRTFAAGSLAALSAPALVKATTAENGRSVRMRPAAAASGGPAASITIPHLAGARAWFSIGTPLTFALNPGPALIEPSVTNPSDPNINQQWDFAELTYNDAQLFANISMVDFVCIPVALNLTDSSGNQQTVQGLPAGGLDTVCAGLTAQASADGQGWNSLIVTSNGQNLRALSQPTAS
jgi:Beta-1,3-glucanase